MVTDFILSSDSFQGALTSLPERVVGFILFFALLMYTFFAQL